MTTSEYLKQVTQERAIFFMALQLACLKIAELSENPRDSDCKIYLDRAELKVKGQGK